MFKTNDSKDRVHYGDLLLPPEGYVLNFAVGTTYSLDLESLTAVCLALGLSEETDGLLLQNPVSMLNAIQKVSEKLLIFCEAGQIKMPGKPSALSLLLEKMIVPVALPKARGINHYPAFHPKTWVLQYTAKLEIKSSLAVLLCLYKMTTTLFGGGREFYGVPAGQFYLSVFNKAKTVLKSDIDDLLLNSLGFIIGYLLYLLARVVSKKVSRIK